MCYDIIAHLVCICVCVFLRSSTAAAVIQRQWRKCRQRLGNVRNSSMAENEGGRGDKGMTESGPSHINGSAGCQDYAATVIQVKQLEFSLTCSHDLLCRNHIQVMKQQLSDCVSHLCVLLQHPPASQFSLCCHFERTLSKPRVCCGAGNE